MPRIIPKPWTSPSQIDVIHNIPTRSIIESPRDPAMTGDYHPDTEPPYCDLLDKTPEPLTDDELIAQLSGQVQTLQSQLASVEERYEKYSLTPRYVVLAVSVGLLVFVFAITMAPYLYPSQPLARNVPTVLTYVGSFGIVIFGYLTYRSFAGLITAIEARRTIQFTLNDGKCRRRASRVSCSLRRSMRRELMTPKLRAQLENSKAEVESVNRRIEKISGVTNKNVVATARKYSRERSSVLVGIIGGIVGDRRERRGDRDHHCGGAGDRRRPSRDGARGGHGDLRLEG